MQQLLKRIKGDKAIWSVVLTLSLISLMAVYSSTETLAYKQDKNAIYFLIKQILVIGVGLVIIFVVHKINYTKFAKLAVMLYAISLPLLLYTLLFGAKINQGSRWIKLPIIDATFQSSDLAKLSLFMFLARSLSLKQGTIQDLKKGFFPVLVPVFLTCGLIAPENLSTALMLGATCCILFFIGRVQVKHIAMLAVAGLLCVALLFTFSKLTGIGRAATWEKRVTDFAGGNGDTVAHQVKQARIAIANGRFFGLGPGHSRQRDHLPEAFSDFIFVTIIEEYGFMGGMFIVSLYLLFLWRCIVIFKRCPYAFGAFLAVGLGITLVFQAMLNMGVNVGLMPVTGLTLPMVSMGGSSIWFNSIAIGIILSVSRYVDEMEGEESQTQQLMIDDTINENKAELA